MTAFDHSRLPAEPAHRLDPDHPAKPITQMANEKSSTMPTGPTELSRYDPMRRIIAFDDFDRGFCGWTQLVGNYEHSLDSMLPGFAEHTQPQLSNVTHWDAGSHGAFDGTYALKIATRPRAG